MARTATTRMFHRLVRFLADNPGMKTLPEISAGLNYTYTYVIAPDLWRAKQFGADIVPHKSGREVLGYELLNGPAMLTALAAFDTSTVKTPKIKKNAKAALIPLANPATPAAAVPVPAPAKPKAAKAKPAKTKLPKPVAMESDEIPTVSTKPVDILDEIDTDLVTFEDRSFAEDYVKAL